MPERMVFLWDNFGPMHADRCEAVARADPTAQVTGLELNEKSNVYDWAPETGATFEKITLFKHGKRPSSLAMLRALIAFRAIHGRAKWFLCHYDKSAILAFAIYLRLRGDKVFVMGCSKFDDHPRKTWREWLKSFYLLPYQGAIGSGERSRAYFQFLGLPASKIHGEYNTVSLRRIQNLAGGDPAPKGIPFDARDFIIIARLQPKKNLSVALEAFALYAQTAQTPRKLHICGSGPLEDELRAQVQSLGLSQSILFHGFLQTEEIAKRLAKSLVLLLPSTEEQFGNVVIEAQAMGVPVILSKACGAADILIQNGLNGFNIDPKSPRALCNFMAQLSENKSLWEEMAKASQQRAPLNDVSAFASAVNKLAGSKR
ncbi:MAG: glycosyltransferase family 4 protein [Paracoccaceae bacterium]